MSFTAKDVKALRDATGAGMMDAKKALEAADGDMEAAKQALREKGLAKADARSDRDNDEGTVAIAVDGNTAAVVQIKTETDFSAKNNAVTTLAQTLADAVLTGGPGAVDAPPMPSMISRSRSRRTSNWGRSSRSSPPTATSSTPTCTARTGAG